MRRICAHCRRAPAGPSGFCDRCAQLRVQYLERIIAEASAESPAGRIPPDRALQITAGLCAVCITSANLDRAGLCPECAAGFDRAHRVQRVSLEEWIRLKQAGPRRPTAAEGA